MSHSHNSALQTGNRSPAAKSWLTTWWESLSLMSRSAVLMLAAPLIVLNVWALSTIFSYFRSILVTVVVAALLAFLLNYPIHWFERVGLRRTQSAILVFLIFVLGVFVVGVTVLPLVITQAQQLVARLPEWFDSGKNQLLMLDQYVEDMGWPINLDVLIAQANDRLKSQIQTVGREALNLTLGVAFFTANKLFDVLLTVILTFYLLQHGDEVWAGIVSWLPEQVQIPFSQTLRRSFSSYFLGQLIVATSMGVALTVMFTLLQIPFGQLFGLTIGLAAIIPFGGTVGIAVVTFLVALQDVGTAVKVLVSAVIVQQLVENGIAPRVLGSVTGLNPFWVFIAILAGARVGGLLGVIVAVPSAVLIREALFAIRAARQSSIAIPESEGEIAINTVGDRPALTASSEE
jgi:predicted PurR-regulated permease PerM